MKIDEHSAGFIVFKENNGLRQYLILHYPGGHFDFAKGHLEKGETAKEAAIRELEEETGIKGIHIIEGFETKISYGFTRRGGAIGKEVTFFLGKAGEEEVRISHEHRAAMWLDYEAAQKKVTFDNAKHVLHAAEQFLKLLSKNKS